MDTSVPKLPISKDELYDLLESGRMDEPALAHELTMVAEDQQRALTRFQDRIDKMGRVIDKLEKKLERVQNERKRLESRLEAYGPFALPE